MKRVIVAFFAGLLVMPGGAYLWSVDRDPLAPKDEPKPEVDHGPWNRTETIAVGEVLNSVRRLNRLVIFQAYVTATTTTHDVGWMTQSDQTMLTPAFVNYYIDMDTIKADDIRVRGKHVYLSRPTIMIERPNIDTRGVQIFNDGVWTNLTGVSERLRIRNSRMALKQLAHRAKMPFLVKAAREGAIAAEEVNVRRVLAAAGITDVTIHIGSQ